MSVAVFISGRGTNLQNLIKAGVPISCVFTNNPNAGGLEFAKNAGIPTEILSEEHIPKIKGDSKSIEQYNHWLNNEKSAIIGALIAYRMLGETSSIFQKLRSVNKDLVEKVIEITDKNCPDISIEVEGEEAIFVDKLTYNMSAFSKNEYEFLRAIIDHREIFDSYLSGNFTKMEYYEFHKERLDAFFDKQILKFYETDILRAVYFEKVCDILAKYEPRLIVLAGFMRILPSEFIQKWEGRIVNIHPSLLPAFKGVNAVEEAFEYGVKIMGATVHFVSNEVDGGRIIDQEAYTVEPDDTIETIKAKLALTEAVLYPRAILNIIK
jgi:phosphoribosylglycinamide formyltransferase-1